MVGTTVGISGCQQLQLQQARSLYGSLSGALLNLLSCCEGDGSPSAWQLLTRQQIGHHCEQATADDQLMNNQSA